VLLVLVAAVPDRSARATPVLRLAAEFGGGPTLLLTVANTGTEPATDVVPHVVYRHGTFVGEPAEIAPGARHAWQLSLPAPPGRGTYPVTTRVRYADAGGAARSVPVVALLSTPEAPPEAVRATLTAAAPGTVRLLLENTGPRPVAGRVISVLPSGLGSEPETHPVAIPAGGRRAVPMTLLWRGAATGSAHPVWAVFEYLEAGAHHATAARVDVTMPPHPGRARVLPLAVGAAALGLTLVVLAAAWRRVVPRA
jgi:hypothetical protein